MSQRINRGQIISFYSFKGGVGRTMALANIGSYLARKKRPDGTRSKVLLIDWDLESPGLHYYLYREGLPKKQRGVVQLIDDLNIAETLSSIKNEVAKFEKFSEVLDEFDFSEYCHPVPNNSPSLSFMPASNSIASMYHDDLLKIDWLALDDLGSWIVPLIIQKLATQFDYVLLDSRTGLSDTGCITGGMIPDKMVFVFNFNRQSLYGSRSFFQKVMPLRDENAKNGSAPPLEIFPLASMIQEGIPRDFDDWINNPVYGVKRYLADILKKDGATLEDSEEEWRNYVTRFYIPYLSQLAYGEQILTNNELSIGYHSVAKRYGEFAEHIIGEAGQTETSIESASVNQVENDKAEPFARAASYLGALVDTTHTYHQIGSKNVSIMKGFLEAFSYPNLGQSLLNISRHYIETANTALDPRDSWATVWYGYAKEKLDETEKELGLLARQELPEGFSAIDGGFWAKELWTRANEGIWTTNVAGIGQSLGRQLDISAIEAQGKAVNRGVPVTRVFVLEEHEDEFSRAKLVDIVKAQLNVGITVYFIRRDEFEDTRRIAEEHFASEDFMIVDDNFVYVTERVRNKDSRGTSSPKRIRILNSKTKLRFASELRRKITAAATQIQSQDNVEKMLKGKAQGVQNGVPR